MTVLPASGTLGAHGETLPAPSMLRYCTMVTPSPVTPAGLAATGAVQFTPLSTDRRYSYPASPDPPLSLDPDADTATDVAACHEREPPVTAGALGTVPSSRTVPPGLWAAGAQGEVLPAW